MSNIQKGMTPCWTAWAQEYISRFHYAFTHEYTAPMVLYQLPQSVHYHWRKQVTENKPAVHLAVNVNIQHGREALPLMPSAVLSVKKYFTESVHSRVLRKKNTIDKVIQDAGTQSTFEQVLNERKTQMETVWRSLKQHRTQNKITSDPGIIEQATWVINHGKEFLQQTKRLRRIEHVSELINKQNTFESPKKIVRKTSVQQPETGQSSTPGGERLPPIATGWQSAAENVMPGALSATSMGVNIEDLADKVVRRIDSRIDAQRERLGKGF